jgi:hypothetical protein
MATTSASTSKILGAVTALARDLAPGELTLSVSREDALPVALTVQHAATFAVAIQPGQGPLPEQVRRFDAMAAMRAELDARLSTVRQEAGPLIDTWVAQSGATYTSMLPPERCMRDRPVLGVQEVCGACGGQRQVTCPGCRGGGRVTCSTCGGRARVTCAGCGGSRQSRCYSCGGSGTHEVREFEVSYSDQQNTMNQQRQLTRRVPCPGCGGRGSNPCTSCADGTQACTCMSGQVICSGCGGRGIVPCGACAATGVVHQTGRIQCTVSRGIRVETVAGDDEDRRTLCERAPLERLGAMAADTGGVQLEAVKRVEHQATLNYAASIRRECVEASARGRTATIHVYGPGRDVFDHHDLVGTLLEPDLAALESSARGNALRSAVSGSSLPRETRKFLASEVNTLIAEAAPQVDEDGAGANARAAGIGRAIAHALLLAPVVRRFRRAGILLKLLMVVVGINLLLSPQLLGWYGIIAAACVFYERRYQQSRPGGTAEGAADPTPAAGDRSAAVVQAAVRDGLVSADYVRRARLAVGRALPRLYGPLMLSAGLWLTGGLLVLFLGAKLTFPVWPMAQKALPLLAITAVTWLVLERRASASLEALLGTALYARLKARFAATRNLYRVVPLVGFLFAWLVVDFAVNLLTHLRYGTPLFMW